MVLELHCQERLRPVAEPAIKLLRAGEVQIAAALVGVGDVHDLTGDRAVRRHIVHVGLAGFRDERHGWQIALDAGASSHRDSERIVAHDLESQLLAFVLQIEGAGIGVRERLGLHQDPLAQPRRVRFRGQCNADLDQFAIGFGRALMDVHGGGLLHSPRLHAVAT